MRTISRLLTIVIGVAGLVAAGCQSAAPKAAAGNRPPGGSTADLKDRAPGERTVAELHAALRDPDLNVRINTVEELGHRVSEQEAVAALVEGLADPAPLVRRFAAGGLAEVQAPSASTALALGRLLKDPDNDPRDSASRSLAALAPRVPADAVPELGAMLSAAAADPEEAVRSHALEALGGLGARGARVVPAMRPALERALSDKSDEVRSAAVAAIGKLGAGVPGTVALLARALSDPVHDVRKMAIIALEQIGPDAAPATRAIVPLLRGKEIYLRVFAADALTAIGPGAKAALPALKALAAKGYADIAQSPESEAKQLPEAVSRAIRSLEGKPPG